VVAVVQKNPAGQCQVGRINQPADALLYIVVVVAVHNVVLELESLATDVQIKGIGTFFKIMSRGYQEVTGIHLWGCKTFNA